jgi:hypothetical protein
MPGNPAKTASQATCATWDPYENPDPPGCDWFDRPPEPPDDGSGSGGGAPPPAPAAGGPPVPIPTVPAP